VVRQVGVIVASCQPQAQVRRGECSPEQRLSRVPASSLCNIDHIMAVSDKTALDGLRSGTRLVLVVKNDIEK